MDLRRDETKRTARAPAKLNLYLDVLGRRTDGFHELETLMVPVRLWDRLTMRPTPPHQNGRPGDIRLSVRSALPMRSPPRAADSIPADARNLVVRALELLQQRSGCAVGAKVELDKRIPAAAGLGGGSSDAACALRLANHVWQLSWSSDRLAELAAELGSDVPFFLGRGPAVCRGRGERVEPISGARPLNFIIAVPLDGLSTADVYHAHDTLTSSEQHTGGPSLVRVVDAFRRSRLSHLADAMDNRLQAAADNICPWIARARAAFARLDCLAHQLSGSGSAYFGLCRHWAHARRLASILRVLNFGHVYPVRSCP